MKHSKTRIFTSVLIGMLVLVCVFALTACDESHDEAKQAAGKQNAAVSGSVEDNAKANMGDSQTEPMKSSEQVRQSLGDKYYIALSIGGYASESASSAEYTCVTASDGEFFYWKGQEDTAVLLRKQGDNTYLTYQFDQSLQKYVSVTEFTGAKSFDAFSVVSAIFMTDSSISYTSKSDVTVAGRACTKYVNTESEIAVTADYTMNEEWCIDQATGACLKHNWTFSGQSLGYLGNLALSFECTQFVTGDAVNALIARETRKIAVKDWDAGFYKQTGLTAVAAKPDATLFNATLRGAEYSVTYLYSGDRLSRNNDVEALVRSFFENGADRDAEGNAYASYRDDAVYSEYLSEDYSYIAFDNAYTSIGSKFTINAFYSQDYHAWVVTIKALRAE